MAEVRGQVGIAEGHRERVGVVQHRHELARRRLGAAAEVEEADVAVVVEIVEEHRAGGPVDPLVVVADAVGLVVGVGRVRRDAELGAGLAFLVHQGEAGALVDVAVEDVVGIIRVRGFAVAQVLHPGLGCIILETGTGVEGVLFRIVLVPAVLVAGLEVEVPAERLGIDDTGAEAAGDGRLVDALVDEVGIAVVSIRNGLVPGVELVAGEVPGQVRRNRAAGHAEALAEEEEAVRLHGLAVAAVAGEALVGVAQDVVRQGLGVELRELVVVAAADIELRLEEDGGVLGELVLNAEAEPVAVRAAAAQTVVVGDERGAVFQVGFLVGVFLDVGLRAAVKVVAAEVHLVAEEVPVAVDAAHPASQDAVGAAPAAAHAAATAHSAAAHGAHHRAGHVVEAAVVGVVAVEDDAYLALVGEPAAHEGALIAPVAVIPGQRGRGDIVSAAGHGVAEHAVHHASLDGQVDDGLLFTVVDAGEFGLLGFLFDDLHFLDQLRRDVLRGELGVVEEEGLAADGDLGDGLAAGGDRAVGIDFNARQFLQQVDEHVVVADLEGGGIVLDGVLLDDDRVAGCGDRRGVEHTQVDVHLEGAEVEVLPVKLEFAGQRLVAQHFRRQCIGTLAHFFESGLTICIRQRIGRLGGRIALLGDGDGGERDGFVIRRVRKRERDIVPLRKGCR